MQIKYLTSIFLLFTFNAYTQDATTYLENGIEKHKNKDFKGAKKEYTKVIELDKTNVSAHYNRAVCEYALGNIEKAFVDYSKTIALDSTFVKALYGRAIIYVNKEKYNEAILDLDKLILVDSTITSAYTLRGQLRIVKNDLNSGCNDFVKAKQMGDLEAEKFINQHCRTIITTGSEKIVNEELELFWPENEKWKIGSQQENSQMAVVELIREGETLENWTEIGTMTSYKNVPRIPVDDAMNLIYGTAKTNAINPKITFIEKDETAKYPWIIFKIESPKFRNDKIPESQVWMLIQGEKTMYSVFRAVKQAEIPLELQEKWVSFLKTSKVVSQ